LPETEFEHFNSLKGNSQSILLQAVRNAIKDKYPRSDVHADGQIVKINFTDGMKFEVLPAFENNSGFLSVATIYKHPDTNDGGSWSCTNPRAEQEAMKRKNDSSRGLLFDTCKHFRRIRDDHFSSYTLSGWVIDSFVYVAMGDWQWAKDDETSSASQGDYESVLLNYLNQNQYALSLRAPGSNVVVPIDKSIECLKKVVKYIAE
jgi:hypothetical protein